MTGTQHDHRRLGRLHQRIWQLPDRPERSSGQAQMLHAAHELTERHGDPLAELDPALARGLAARACALAGQPEADRSLFLGQLPAEPWLGLAGDTGATPGVAW